MGSTRREISQKECLAVCPRVFSNLIFMNNAYETFELFEKHRNSIMLSAPPYLLFENSLLDIYLDSRVIGLPDTGCYFKWKV